METYTIKQALNEVGISRQALNVRMKKLGISAIKKGRNSTITLEQLEQIKELNENNTASTSQAKCDNVDVSLLYEVRIKDMETQLSYLKDQIHLEKQERAATLRALLMSQQKIKELEQENRLLLEPPKSKSWNSQNNDLSQESREWLQNFKSDVMETQAVIQTTFDKISSL